MLTSRFINKQITEKSYTVRGKVGNRPILLTLNGINVIDVVSKAKTQYPKLEITAIQLEKGANI